MLTEFLALALTALAGFALWQRHRFNYWQRNNVKFIKPSPIFGNMRELFSMKATFSEQLWTLYKQPGYEKEPLAGIFTLFRPAVLIRDLDLIKRIMIKDFTIFTNRVLRSDPHHDPLGSNNLFLVRSTEWRELRPKLSPVFTSGKVKQMYPLMTEIGKDLESLLSNYASGSVIEMKDICARFTTDLIGTTAFGVRANSLRNPQSDFYLRSRAIFEVTIRRMFDFILTLLVPSLNSLLRVKLFSARTSDFLRTSIAHVMAERERTGMKRHDLVDALVTMKKDPTNATKSHDFYVAQAAIFQTAGFETSSSTMSFTLYELARHPEVQERLRAEIVEAFDENPEALPYEKLQELPYLSQVVDETLRLYPIVGFLERESSSDYSLKPYNDFTIPAGTPFYVSPLGVQRDERYWVDPHSFKPERFAPENRQNLNMHAYMPFGTGPRNCIGMRIGLLQSKLGLVHLLRNHRVTTCDQTTKNVVFDPKSVVLANKGNVYLKLERVA